MGEETRTPQIIKLLKEIDPRLRGLVFFLNKDGHTTEQSCEGHAAEHLGFIGFTADFFKNNLVALKNICNEFEKRRAYTEQRVWIKENENALFFHLEPMNGEDAMGLLLAVIGEEFDADERWQTIIRSGEIPDQEEI